MWRDEVVEKSWTTLQRLRGEFSFTLIGGWAVYLYTKALKSRDIDIIVDHSVLMRLKESYDLRKNDRLKKYEFISDRVEVDTYVPYYSSLGIPAEEIQNKALSLSGFSVPTPEHLLVTKQKAEIDRTGSEKGMKDRIDIIALLLQADLDMGAYRRILAEYNLEGYLERLRSVVSDARSEFNMLGYTDFRRFKLQKRKLLGRIDATRD